MTEYDRRRFRLLWHAALDCVQPTTDAGALPPCATLYSIADYFADVAALAGADGSGWVVVFCEGPGSWLRCCSSADCKSWGKADMILSCAD